MSTILTIAHKVLADGYKVSGGADQPVKAVVPYLVAWADAFNFYSQVLGYTSATTAGPITYHVGHQFPPAPTLFAQYAEIEPCGASGTTGPNLGLAPGEFFTHARVTVTYQSLPWPQPGDASGNLQQLDPNNPITLCEQELETGGKFQTVKGEGLEFDDGTPVTGNQVVSLAETKLVLTFPRVPFMPWQITKDYVGKINLNSIFGCDKGTLLFEGQRTKFTETDLGIQGKQLQLILVHADEDWNTGIKPDGSHALMRWKSDHSTRNYKYIDFALMFQAMVVNSG